MAPGIAEWCAAIIVINSDKILVFDNGEIVESGKHEILIESNDKYKKLYDLQFNNE